MKTLTVMPMVLMMPMVMMMLLMMMPMVMLMLMMLLIVMMMMMTMMLMMMMLMVLVLMMWHCIGLSRSAFLQTTMMMLMMMVIMVLMMMIILMQIRLSDQKYFFRNYEIECLRFRIFFKNDFQSRLLQSRFLQKKISKRLRRSRGPNSFSVVPFHFFGKKTTLKKSTLKIVFEKNPKSQTLQSRTT